ncbi:MAG: cytochrome c3 family protein [Anaerolineales bacterium]|nr:cytochrome c3 family protein [Anaerolineales bacterium]
MIDKVILWLKQPIGIVALLIAGVALLSVAGWGIAENQKTPEQPIEFPHKLHVNLGMQCLYCHPGAVKGGSSGLPTQTKCWGCHQQIAMKGSELPKLASYVENNEPIPWVPVAIVPDFVHFRHRPHLAAGLNCENCHGDMTKVNIAENPQVMNMGWCLDCHRVEAASDEEKLIKLTDCGTCHY